MSIATNRELGRMYKEQITLNRFILKCIAAGELSKKEVLAMEVGITIDELNNYLSRTPRTLIPDGIKDAIEGWMFENASPIYEAYLQDLHQNDNIRIILGSY